MTRMQATLGKGLPNRGKPLHLLLKNLPNHGVGRLIIRGSSLQLEGAPSYMRILKVDMTPVVRKKRNKLKRTDMLKMVKVERTYRGHVRTKPVNISSTSNLYDFYLVSKEEEHKYLKNSVTALNKEHFEDLDETQRTADDYGEDDHENENENYPEDSQEFDENVGNCETNNVNNKEVNEEGTRPERHDNPQQNGNKERKGMGTEKQVQSDAKSWCEEEEFGDFTEDQIQRINNMVNTGIHADTAKQIEWERDQAFKIATANELIEEETKILLKRPHASRQSKNVLNDIKKK